MINVWKVFAKLLFWVDSYLFKQTYYSLPYTHKEFALLRQWIRLFFLYHLPTTTQPPTAQVETFYLWTNSTKQSQQSAQRQLALARIQTPELMLYFWSGGKHGNHCTNRAGSVMVTNSQITWALTCANTGSCRWPWLALVATVTHMVVNSHTMWLAR